MTTTRVPRIDQALQDLDQFLDVGHVQSDRRLVQHIQGVLPFAARDVEAHRIGARLGELGDQLDALALAARERGARLAETQVAEAHVGQQLHTMADGAMRGKEFHRLIDRQRQRLHRCSCP